MATGQIRDRGKGKEVRVYAGRDPDTGKERRIYRTVRWQGSKKATTDEANRVLRRILDELDAGAHHGPATNLAALLDAWARARQPDWSPKNRDETARFVTRIKAAIGDVKLRDVTAETLDTFYADLRAAGLGASSVHRYHDVCHAALEQAVRWDWLLRNPASRANPGRPDRTKITPPTDDEVHALLRHFRDTDPVFYVYLVLASVVGSRRGELCALRWADVDLDAGTVQVRGAISGNEARDRTKEDDRRPPAPLDPDTLALLREHRQRCAEQALATGVGLPADQFVFTRYDRRTGQVTHWRPDSVTQKFARGRARLGLDHVQLRAFRHFVATQMLADGTAIGEVADRLGHTNASTTLNIYRGHVPAAGQAAAERHGARVHRRTV